MLIFFVTNFYIFRLGSDPEKLFSYEALLSQLKQYGIYILIPSTFLIHVMYCIKETIPNDIKDHCSEEAFLMSTESQPKYEKHVLDLFTDLDRFGYI